MDVEKRKKKKNCVYVWLYSVWLQRWLLVHRQTTITTQTPVPVGGEPVCQPASVTNAGSWWHRFPPFQLRFQTESTSVCDVVYERPASLSERPCNTVQVNHGCIKDQSGGAVIDNVVKGVKWLFLKRKTKVFYLLSLSPKIFTCWSLWLLKSSVFSWL